MNIVKENNLLRRRNIELATQVVKLEQTVKKYQKLIDDVKAQKAEYERLIAEVQEIRGKFRE